MPHFTFIAIASCAVIAGLALRQMSLKPAPVPKVKPVELDVAKPGEPEVGVAPIVLDLHADLTGLTTNDDGVFVTRELTLVRDRIFHELGVRVPGVRVRTGAPLPPGGYMVQVDEVPSAVGQVSLGHLLALA